MVAPVFDCSGGAVKLRLQWMCHNPRSPSVDLRSTLSLLHLARCLLVTLWSSSVTALGAAGVGRRHRRIAPRRPRAREPTDRPTAAWMDRSTRTRGRAATGARRRTRRKSRTRSPTRTGRRARTRDPSPFARELQQRGSRRATTMLPTLPTAGSRSFSARPRPPRATCPRSAAPRAPSASTAAARTPPPASRRCRSSARSPTPPRSSSWSPKVLRP